jgi:hypothetical protein
MQKKERGKKKKEREKKEEEGGNYCLARLIRVTKIALSSPDSAFS